MNLNIIMHRTDNNKLKKIILIGMPGSGKTTIMNHFSIKNIKCIDVDFLIEPNPKKFEQ